MAIPERMRPVKVTSKKIRELAQKAKEILAAIDGGASEKDAFLKEMIDEWNSQVYVHMSSRILEIFPLGRMQMNLPE